MEKSKKKLIGIIAAVVAVVLVIIGVVAAVFLTKDKDEDTNKPKTEEVGKTEEPTTEAPKTFEGDWLGSMAVPIEDGVEMAIEFKMSFKTDGTISFIVDREKLADTYKDILLKAMESEANANGMTIEQFAAQIGYSSVEEMFEAALPEIIASSGYSDFDAMVEDLAAFCEGEMDGSTWEKTSDTEIKFVDPNGVTEIDTYKFDGDSKLTLTTPESESVIELTRA